jgi:hypothetical protein
VSAAGLLGRDRSGIVGGLIEVETIDRQKGVTLLNAL